MKTNPVLGEVWTDVNYPWGDEPHIGEVTISMNMGGFVSYIRSDKRMGVMDLNDFFLWFDKKETE